MVGQRIRNGGFWQSVADFKAKFGRKKEDAIVALVSQRSIEDAPRGARRTGSRYHASNRGPRRPSPARALGVMRTVTSRIAKLEDRLGISDGRPGFLVVVCHAGCNLNHDWCIGVLRECGFLPTSDAGVLTVDLCEIPFGLSEEELKRFLRENGAEICGLRDAQNQGGQAGAGVYRGETAK